MRVTQRFGRAIVLLFATAWAATAAAAGRSTEAAAELVMLMQARNLEAFAAEDPAAPGHFVAAMLVPDVQLLVVAARPTAPDYLTAQVAAGNYREAYLTLHGAAVAETKVFFQDMGCDGLSGDEGSVDILYERAATQTVFDGDWRGQKLSKAEYEQKLRDADQRYSRLLAVLTEALRGSAGAGRSGGEPHAN